jgi:hypothetical protein
MPFGSTMRMPQNLTAEEVGHPEEGLEPDPVAGQRVHSALLAVDHADGVPDDQTRFP